MVNAILVSCYRMKYVRIFVLETIENGALHMCAGLVWFGWLESTQH